MSHPPVIYASATWGIHDQRWAAALEANGLSVRVMKHGPHLRAEVTDAVPPQAPVLAGPLTPVARDLVGLPRRIVGLSWGFDLQSGHSRSPDTATLSWLAQLDALIVDSPSTRDIAIGLGVPAARIHLIPWGIDLTAFPAEGPAADFAFPPDAVVVLSLRTHDDLYRTADVIEAFSLAAADDPRLRLVMGGSGPLTDTHRRRVHELGLDDKVVFPGVVPEEQVGELMRGADLYVTASETDGTSVTLLQAMACRIPVLASDIPGNRWWIEDGETGRTFPVGDVRALAALMVVDPTATQRADHAITAVVERADWNLNRLALREIMLGTS